MQLLSCSEVGREGGKEREREGERGGMREGMREGGGGGENEGGREREGRFNKINNTYNLKEVREGARRRKSVYKREGEREREMGDLIN